MLQDGQPHQRPARGVIDDFKANAIPLRDSVCVCDCICLVSQFINKTVPEETALFSLIALIIWSLRWTHPSQHNQRTLWILSKPVIYLTG
jgi:hypothetical protein